MSDKNKKILIKSLPYFFLAILVLLQAKSFRKFNAAKRAVTVTLQNRSETFLAPKWNSLGSPFYNFAGEVSEILPDGARVAFVYDKTDYADIKYYLARFYMKPKINAQYTILEKIDSKETIVDYMESVGTEYLVVGPRPDIVKIVLPGSTQQTAVFKLNGRELEQIYSYDLGHYVP